MRVWKSWTVGCFCWLGLAATTARAAEQALLAVTFDGEILRVDPATGHGTQIGAMPGPSDAMGLAYYAGEVYVLDQINDRLVVVDPVTAAVRRTVAVNEATGSFGVFSEGDFEIAPDGRGYYTESDARFSTLDIATGVANQLTSSTEYNIDGLAFDQNGVLYAYQTGGLILTGDPTTGMFTGKWSIGSLPGVYAGLEVTPGGDLLLAVDETLYRIDGASGARSTVGPVGFDKVSGLTWATVPEPTALCAAAGLAVLLRRPGRRR